MSATSTDVFGPWMKKILDPTFQARLNYGISPLFLGLTSGPMYGGITGIMMNMAGTPELQLRILRHTALFSMMGLSYGAVGIASLINRDDKDDMTTRIMSGCAAGLTLGLANKSLGSACGACVSLAAVSAAMKFVDDKKSTLGTPDPKIQESLKPVLISDIPALKP